MPNNYFCCPALIGFDPTIEIHPPPLNRQRHSAREIALSPNDANDDTHLVEKAVSPSPTEPAEAPPQPPNPDVTSPSLPSPNQEPASIGKIRVDDAYYDIIDILFSSTDFVGRGTVCYLARLDGVYYVIKDYWVQSEGIYDPRMIHEAKMMDYVKDIDGVPKLHKAWVVEVEDGVPDTTARYREEKYRGKMQSPRTHVRLVMTPCARPLTIFKSKKEFVKCIRDVLGGKYTFDTILLCTS